MPALEAGPSCRSEAPRRSLTGSFREYVLFSERLDDLRLVWRMERRDIREIALNSKSLTRPYLNGSRGQKCWLRRRHRCERMHDQVVPGVNPDGHTVASVKHNHSQIL